MLQGETGPRSRNEPLNPQPQALNAKPYGPRSEQAEGVEGPMAWMISALPKMQ